VLVAGHGRWATKGWRVGEGRRWAIKPTAPVVERFSSCGPVRSMLSASILRHRIVPQARVERMDAAEDLPRPRAPLIACTNSAAV